MLSKEERKKFNEAIRRRIAHDKLLERNPEMKRYYEQAGYYACKFHDTKDKTFLYMFRNALHQLSLLGYFGKMSAIEGDKAGQCFWEIIEKKTYEKLIECIENYPEKLLNIHNDYQKIIINIIKERVKVLLKDIKQEERSVLYNALKAKFESLPYVDIQAIAEEAEKEFELESKEENSQPEPHKRERFFLQKTRRRP